MNFTRQIALFKQTMQTDGNSGFHFLLKLLMMLLSFLLLFFTDVIDVVNSGAKGLLMLSLISTANLFFVSVATVSLFCTCFTEEKEHNTLGVMLMTGISPFGFIIGKLLSRLYIVLQLILLQIPLIVVARTLGGLSMDQILAHLVYLISIVIVMSQIGMIFSITSSKSSHSIAFTIIFLIFLSILPCTDSATFFTYYFQIFETGFKEAIFNQPVLYLLGIALALFVLGNLIFDGFSYGDGSGVLNKDMARSSDTGRKRFNKNPIFEKDFRYFSGNTSGMLIRIAGMLIISITYWNFYSSRDLISGITLVWLYSEAFYYSQVMVKREKSSGTLSTLGVLPINPNEILNQKHMAFAISILPSLLTFFIVSVSQNREFVSSLVTVVIFSLGVYSHFAISLLCSIVYERMSLVISVLYILLYSLVLIPCPISWLLFLPSLVILSVNVYEKFALDIAKS